MQVGAAEKVCETGATASVVVSTAGAPVSQSFFASNLSRSSRVGLRIFSPIFFSTRNWGGRPGAELISPPP